MNSTIKLLKEHRSIRKFKNREIEPDILNAILESATKASSSGNMQAYSIIVTQDKKMKKKLYEPHFKQSMLLDAPVFLTFCADFNRMRKWLEINKASPNFDNYMSFMIASIDAVLASQNATIAAESLGLGVCYMGTTLASAHQIGKILDCPDNVVPVAGFALGYPDESPIERERLPMKAVIHQEKYKEFTDDEINKVYSSKNESGMKRYQSNPELNDEIKKQKISNLAQVYTQLKYTRESHLTYSNDVLNYLEEQNFMRNN
ncbi:MAG: nitroreductase family protein [Bacteriovoracaceae bacterium]|nr:nitroreductase family protein [Bacteriovoracaceae bacterium]